MNVSKHYVMPAGDYYIGDLCYVLSDKLWQEYADRDEKCEGVIQLSDGTEICVFETAYGDGDYFSSNAMKFFVDSGTIGCVKMSSLDKDVDVSYGAVVTFTSNFSCDSDNENLSFGDIIIFTNEEDDDLSDID